MKKVFIICFFCGFFITFAFPQDGVHLEDALFFIKRAENNMNKGSYNLDGKKNVEKLFFGDFNAPTEFFYGYSHEGEYGFRIVRKESSYILEVKYISNFEDIREKKSEERLKLSKIGTRSFPISSQFAEKLHRTMVFCIINFKAKAVSDPAIVPVAFGGYTVIFRTVVDRAVLWSLEIRYPKGDTLKLSDLCRQIITDALNSNLDEQKYISVLNLCTGEK
jgi:hypothetical protein